MKKTIIISSLSILLFSCGNTSKPTAHKGNDTTATIVQYVFNADQNDYRTAAAIRFALDTLKPDPSDKTKNIPYKDTLYNVSVILPVTDSLGVALKTKAGKDSMTVRWVTLNKSIILHDYNRNYEGFLSKKK